MRGSLKSGKKVPERTMIQALTPHWSNTGPGVIHNSSEISTSPNCFHLTDYKSMPYLAINE
jgi:hypothetical protein